MHRVTESRTFRIVVALLSSLLCTSLCVSAGLAAPSKRRPAVEIAGFRAGGSALVKPGGTIERACSPRRLVAYVEFTGIRPGALITRRWRLNGNLVKATSVAWNHGRSRRVVRVHIVNPNTLPRGSYQLAVRATGTRWTTGSVRLGC
jgi:hypothetical protein